MINSLNVDALGNYAPIRASQFVDTGASPLNTLNGALVLNTDGDESALVSVVGNAPVMTIAFEGTVDGTNWIPVIATPLFGSGGTIPVLAQPLFTDALVAANTVRVYAVRVAQLKSVRLRVSLYTSGSIAVMIRSDTNRSIHPAVNDRTASTLLVTNTGLVGAAVTLTLPAAAGFRHYVDFIKVYRFATAALTPAATPVLVTTTNLPGAPVFSFPADVSAQGEVYVDSIDCGGAGLAATAIGTAATIVMPAAPGVIWRATAAYRLGY